MTPVYMDFDNCRSTVTSLRESKAILDKTIHDLLIKIDQMVGHTLVGRDADQYRANFQKWNSDIRLLLADLDSLSTALSLEIDLWQMEGG